MANDSKRTHSDHHPHHTIEHAKPSPREGHAHGNSTEEKHSDSSPHPAGDANARHARN